MQLACEYGYESISAVVNPSYVCAHEWSFHIQSYAGELGQQGKMVVTSPQNAVRIG
jgi:hypothetical protein